MKRYNKLIRYVYTKTYKYRFWYIFGLKKVNLKNFFPEIFDEHKIIFTHVPKSAGMAVRESIGIREQIHHIPIKYYEKKKGKNSLQEYFKFTFVRHPISRLVSAYFFIKNGGYLGAKEDLYFANRVMSTFKDFHEFIEWLTPSKVWLYVYFFPQHFFITGRDGTLFQDWIGRYEYIQQDFATLASILKEKGIIVKPLKKKNVTAKKDKVILSKREILKIYEIYKKDFELLGYEPEQWNSK